LLTGPILVWRKRKGGCECGREEGRKEGRKDGRGREEIRKLKARTRNHNP
jgi:hypothetical protein